MRRLSPRGLGARGLTLVLVAVVPLLAFVFLTASDQRADAERNVEQNAVLLARLAADDVEVAIESMRQLLLTFSAEDELEPGQEDRCRRSLGRLLMREPGFVHIGVAREDGAVTCSARPGARSVAQGDPKWLERALAGRGFALGEFQRDRVTGRAVLTAGLRLPGTRAEAERVMFVSLDLAELGRLAREAQLPHDAALSVIDDSGTILARSPSPERFVGRVFRDRPLVRAAFAELEGITTLRGLDRVQRLYAFSRVRGPGLEPIFVSIGVAESEAFAAANENLRRNLLIVAAVSLAALLASLLANTFMIIRPVRGLVGAARRIGAGDLSARAGPGAASGELGELAHAFDEMATALEQRRAELEGYAAELRRTAEERRTLLAKLAAAEEEFRRRVAADIHDDSAQALSAVGLRLDALAEEVGDGEGELIDAARTSIRQANARLRRLLFELRPPVLDSGGLAAAVDAYLAATAEQDGISYRVDDRSEGEARPDTRAILYRIALEALANVRKHARAEHVDVTIARKDQGVMLTIADDGMGFAMEATDRAAPGHLGLVTMDERAGAAGGWWRVTSSPGSGTTVECWLPDGEVRDTATEMGGTLLR